MLPFVNASGDTEMEYLSDGLTESVILALSRLPQLRVMSRSAVFRYKGQTQEPLAAGRALGVETVLTGNVLQRGETLSISAELVDAAHGWQLWGGQYRRKSADLLAVEEEIANEISGTLRSKLSPEQPLSLVRHYTENVAAYHLYLKGRYYAGSAPRQVCSKPFSFFVRPSTLIRPTHWPMWEWRRVIRRSWSMAISPRATPCRRFALPRSTRSRSIRGLTEYEPRWPDTGYFTNGI